ncbi:hypothetical protein B0H10DRAFT_1964512 [Mycena sp. CBHHK59/15]|nr:hypothetical protein B0H10DRAFT_1964512 [Mycena sp. CBHHK59/15]
MTPDLFPTLPNLVVRSNNLMAVGSRSGVLKVFDLGPARKKIIEITVRTAITSLGFVHLDRPGCSQIAVIIELLDGISEAITFCTDNKHHVCDKSNLLENIKAQDENDLKVGALRRDSNLKATSVLD